ATQQNGAATFPRSPKSVSSNSIRALTSYYGNQHQLEYDFEIAPGADPAQIAFRITGATRIQIDSNGDLLLILGTSQIRHRKPVLFQIDHGQRIEVAGGYRLLDERTVTFDIGSYNSRLPLVIDPVLSYSTFFGGQGNDTGRSIA